ncbi:MAG: hypothetical protein RDU89_11750 [bacterium]|nr:hypothetical protein [bacterium]
MPNLSPREALDLHEILRGYSVGATKLQAMLPLVEDADLKAYMQDALQRTQSRMERVREFARGTVS